MRTRLHEARVPHLGCDSVWCMCVGVIAGAASKHQPGLVGAVLELFRELHATGGDTDSSAGGGIGAALPRSGGCCFVHVFVDLQPKFGFFW